jgi:hypothetical protein
MPLAGLDGKWAGPTIVKKSGSAQVSCPFGKLVDASGDVFSHPKKGYFLFSILYFFFGLIIGFLLCFFPDIFPACF